MVPDEFRVNHRAASESLLRAAVTSASQDDIYEELKRAEFFEAEAMASVSTPRQRALGLGLMHAIDLMRAVTDAEFTGPSE